MCMVACLWACVFVSLFCVCDYAGVLPVAVGLGLLLRYG